VASEIPEYSPVYVAQSLGYFSQANLKITTIDNAGSNGTNYLVSGKADLEFYSPVQAELTKSKGQDVKIIYNNQKLRRCRAARIQVGQVDRCAEVEEELCDRFDPAGHQRLLHGLAVQGRPRPELQHQDLCDGAADGGRRDGGLGRRGCRAVLQLADGGRGRPGQPAGGPLDGGVSRPPTCHSCSAALPRSVSRRTWRRRRTRSSPSSRSSRRRPSTSRRPTRRR